MTTAPLLHDMLKILDHELHSQWEQRPESLGLAVSGGGDSMALLDVARRFSDETGLALRVASVDHGLRDVKNELALVANYCRDHNLPHDILTWQRDEATGNLQAQAREGRYEALEAWAKKHALEGVLLGHTKDDQAETILMALMRGSGVDGLAGMAAFKPPLFLRPFLGVSRAELRSYLHSSGLQWAEDPSNEDLKFKRVQVRQALPVLEGLGLSCERLIQTAAHMQRARSSLNLHMQDLSVQYIHSDQGDLLVDWGIFKQSNCDTRARLLCACLQWFSGAQYRVRWGALDLMCAHVCAGKTYTVGGVLCVPQKKHVRLCREVSAILPNTTVNFQSGQVHIWDQRWKLSYLKAESCRLIIRPLGQGIQSIKNWRETGLPYTSVRSLPALYKVECENSAKVSSSEKGHSKLIAVPNLVFSNDFVVKIAVDFHSWLVTHCRLKNNPYFKGKD